MSLATSTPIEYRLYNYSNGSAASGEQEQPYQILEVRLRYLRRLIYFSPSGRVLPQILDETAPTASKNALFHLSLRHLQDPLSYVTQLLSSFNIRAAACKVIAPDIASYIIQIAGENRETNFHIVAEVDYIRLAWMEPTPRRENLEENGEEELETAASVWMNSIPTIRRGR